LLEAFVHVGAPTLQLKLKLKMEKMWKAEEEENGQHDNVAKYTWRWGAEKETRFAESPRDVRTRSVKNLF
jgi:hypothetical protein